MKHLFAIAVILLGFTLSVAQTTPTKTLAAEKDTELSRKIYTPTPEQAKDLKIAQLAAQLAQVQYGARAQTLPEFAEFQKSMTALSMECAKVKDANKWPKEVQCDMQTVPIKFVTPAPAKP